MSPRDLDMNEIMGPTSDGPGSKGVGSIASTPGRSLARSASSAVEGQTTRSLVGLDSHGARIAAHMSGALPDSLETLENRVKRMMEYVRTLERPIDKYVFVQGIAQWDPNVLYAALEKYGAELMPVVYTPTVGEACQKWSSLPIETKGRALYVSARNVGRIREVLDEWEGPPPEILVVTDGGRILGLGDLGAGGMGIPIGKLQLYVAAGGFDPAKCLPVTLDVGTDREELLASVGYRGLRQPRLKGEDHAAFVDEFMTAVSSKWPECVVQFEDFQTDKAIQYMHKYRTLHPSFNDDVQGTAAVVLAGLLGGLKAQGTPLREARVCIFGAGSSSSGVATYFVRTLQEDCGLSEEEAKKHIYVMDSKGLITSSRQDAERLGEWKKPWARTDGVPEMPSLLETVKQVKPHVLIGLSGAGPMFTQPVVEAMVAGCAPKPPLIFPLSNPTSKAECTPTQAVRWSHGHVLMATGSPFDPVVYGHTTIVPGQCNNMYIFPGVGKGAALAKTTQIHDGFLILAAKVVADSVDDSQIEQGNLYPRIDSIREVQKRIAATVWRRAAAEGLARAQPPPDVEAAVEAAFWRPNLYL